MSLFSKNKKSYFNIPDVDYIKYPKNISKKLSITFADQHIRILEESVRYLGDTVYPKTFFGRYEEAIRQTVTILKLCPKHKYGTIAMEMLEKLYKNKEDITIEFLDRCDKAGKLPFVKNDIELYKDEMSDRSYGYFLSLLEKRKSFEDDSEYIFCNVLFSDHGKTYYYLTDDKQICCGDYVVVPVGKANENKVGRVVKIELYNGNNAPVPVEMLKKIIRKN